MSSFWDRSWEQVNADRLKEYMDAFDFQKDEMISKLLDHHAQAVCDAGCGCGIYGLKLALHGFKVSGFDVSRHAVEVAQQLFEKALLEADLKTASILSTGYSDNQFDAVIARDVLDHMTKKDGAAAIKELYRITRPGGIIFLTFDFLDQEYISETHTINNDGDFLFTKGKWQGMVFHPYHQQEILALLPRDADWQMTDSEAGIICQLVKPVD